MIVRQRQGQSTLEFSFAIALVVLLMIGMVKVFIWSGNDLVKRRQAHEKILFEACPSGETGALCGLRQLRPTFYTAEELKVAVPSNIFK